MRCHMLVVVTCLNVLAVFLSEGHAMQQAEPVFDVASIRENTSGASRSSFNVLPNGTTTIVNASLDELVLQAYEIFPALARFTVFGGPEKLMARRFDISATTSGKIGDMPTVDSNRMLRSLLSQRFQLRLHKEMRATPVYAVVMKGDSL